MKRIFLFINPENGWGILSSKTTVTFYQAIQYYTPEIRVMQVYIIFSSLVLKYRVTSSFMLLSVSWYFQPQVTSSLVLLPASCYFQLLVTPNPMLLSSSCYFQPHVTSNLVVLPASWYFKPRVTASLMLLSTSLLSASCYFLKFRSKQSPQHHVTNVPKTNHLLPSVHNTKLSRQNQNVVVWRLVYGCSQETREHKIVDE